MQITFIRSNTNAVGQYRVRHPMLALEALGHECRMLTLGKEVERVYNEELAGDLLILQRQTNARVFDLVDTLPPSRRPRVVYEVDDNPWEWHPFDPIHVELGYQYGRQVREVMARCDAVTCSTPTLARRVRQEFPGMPVWVVPNAIDYQLRNWEAREERAAHNLEGKIVLGWTGSLHHARDGQQLLQALPDVFAAYPEVVFLMQCDTTMYGAWTKSLATRWLDRLLWVPPLPFDVHPMIYSLFDVNLAPLEVTPFNVCKSDLRLIEGGAQGVPYVASKIAPYAEFHEQSGGIGGYLADTPGAWVEGIGKLLEREDVARGETLKRYVRETRALAVVVGQWEAAFQAILADSRGPAIAGGGRPKRNDPCPCGAGVKYKRCCEPAYG